MRVYLERGRRWTFAVALEWPGWARRDRGDEAAVDTLLAYRDRYAAVAGAGFDPGPVEVVGSVAGSATTDFGAPGAMGLWDDEPLAPAEAARQAGVVERCWRAFDAAAGAAPEVLVKGPRGGGRDRDAIVEHVREAERTYGRKFGIRLPPGTPWEEQRRSLAGALATGAGGDWPASYALRRLGWHVLDHAWELIDKTP